MPWPIVIAAGGIAAAMYADNAFQDWLFNEPWTQEKYSIFQRLYSFGPTHDYIDHLYDRRRTSEYMNRNQISWSDIQDPRKLPSSSSFRGFYNMISRNVEDLYK